MAETKENIGEACLLELLDGTLVDTTALVDKVASLFCCQLPDSDRTRAHVPENNGASVGRKINREKLTVVDLPESTCLWSDRVSEKKDRCEIDGEGRTPVVYS